MRSWTEEKRRAAKKLWRDYLRYEYLQEKLNKAKPEDIVKTLTRRYTSLGKSLHEFDHDEVFQKYLNALSHAYDPHTDYFGKAALDDFNIQMKLSLFGIGADGATTMALLVFCFVLWALLSHLSFWGYFL